MASPATAAALLVALAALLAPAAASACSASDRDALLSIRAALSEERLGVFSTWTGTDCCAGWYGVACDPTTGRVADLSLRGEADDAVMAPAGRPASGLMSGYVSDAVCRLDRLSSLVLADWKQISGPIPACVATSLPYLRIIELPGNRLTGAIPPVGGLSRLAVLNLADNLLSGGIPPSLTSLAELKHLDLTNNRLTGRLPSDFGRLRMLSRALLGRNRLSGPMPASVASMPRLADLDLSENQLTGAIPEGLGRGGSGTAGNGGNVLTSLYLGGNRLSGGVRASLLANSGLGMLNLSRNALGGGIPDAFTPRSYFMLLDLSRNRFTGGVPRSLASAAYVGHLDLSHNRLCGTIPAGAPFDHLDAASFASNSCLCGGPLGKCT
ncbi:DNA damage-repair/toleration protein DRT100-like [Miscanthus floridulus]|uniref:DNA damage-repair/toleration protein DRT100-like n=1 Tax=Miscanthus floridulus TaxID=154761 RepID=UPI0034583FDD